MYNSISIFFLLEAVSGGQWYIANNQNASLKQNLENNINKVEPIETIPITLPSENKFSRSEEFHKLQDWFRLQDMKDQEQSREKISETLHNFQSRRRKLNKTSTVENSKRLTPKLRKSAQSRILELFEVVSFDHIQCMSPDGLEGKCVHEYDCLKSGGKSMGICADGYGTCCVVQYICDTESKAKTGWFTNPVFPLPNEERLSCTVIIHKASKDVKQIRLDFLNFEIHAPTYGYCEHDQFIVTGQNINNIVPILCGVNTGQHVYVEVGSVDGPVSLSLQTVTTESRIFAVKVTQLKPDHELAAPTGCLQYYKGEQGHIESFNYRDRSEIELGNIPSYLNNLNYAMCIERQTDKCSVTYTNVGNMQVVNYDTDGLPVIPPKQAGVEIFNCPSDWLLISAVRLCGERLNDGSVLQDFSLNAPVTDDGVGPIVIWFRSDSVYTGRGFKLHFKQNSCSVTT